MNSLKLTFFSLIFFLVAGTVSAQLGVRAGIALSDQHIDPDDNVETSSLLGFSAGIMVEINVTDRFALQPELLFVQNGVYKDEFLPIQEVRWQADFKQNSLLLAVMTRYDIVRLGESGGLYLGLSPFFSYGMDVLVEGETITPSASVEIDASVKNRNIGWRRADYGVGAGLGVRFGNFVLDARYNYGLANLERFDDDVTINSRSILLGLGYYF
ncbi:MAG: PorT family protein [Saprospirales bacterium]|nr:MAG: PorT family protein [Saprospirales bacterium]